jgi:hypothetical protein
MVYYTQIAEEPVFAADAGKRLFRAGPAEKDKAGGGRGGYGMKTNKREQRWWGPTAFLLFTGYMLASFYWIEPRLARLSAGQALSRALSAAVLLGWLALAFFAGRRRAGRLLRAQLVCGVYPFIGLLVMEFLEASVFQIFDVLFFVAVSPWQGVMGLIPRLPNWAAWLFCAAVPLLQGLLYWLGRRGAPAGGTLSYRPSALRQPGPGLSSEKPEGPLSQGE